ncbi:hypothetical protein KEM52_006072 [Ascosphaera acerosa]|nr:hypothetical protein KEM52_006072 [Ascosphaera acerosa]
MVLDADSGVFKPWQSPQEAGDTDRRRDSGVAWADSDQDISPTTQPATNVDIPTQQGVSKPSKEQKPSASYSPVTQDVSDSGASAKPAPLQRASPSCGEQGSPGPRPQADTISAMELHPCPRVEHVLAKNDPRLPGSKSAFEIGSVVKAERLLVRVDLVEREPPFHYDETFAYNIPVKAKRVWKEYICVCRRVAGPCAPFQLEFYTHRGIQLQQVEKRLSRKLRYSFRVMLDCNTTHVNIWSALDKSIVMWHQNEGKPSYKRYIMRTKSPFHTMEWYTFIRETLGFRRPSQLLVHIPELNLQIELHNVIEQYGKNAHALARKDEAGGLELLRSVTINPQQAVSEGIIESCLETLRGNTRYGGLIANWDKFHRLGLAWRRYDRLEWVHGANERRMHGILAMNRTHQLELRPRTHYPTSVRLAGEEVQEPPPVEGFLILLTSKMGKYSRLGKRLSRRVYCSTQDQLLCFTGPARAAPPGPPRLPEASALQFPGKVIRREMPLLYDIDPYPIAEDTICWLRVGRRQIAREYDLEAYREYLRNTTNLRRTEGYFELTQVSEVRTVQNPILPPWWKGVWQSAYKSDGLREEPNPEEAVFELVMYDGLRVRFRAFNSRTRDEWVSRLSALVAYWKKRLQDDLALMRSLRQQNLHALHIREVHESQRGQFAQKWEVSQADASPKVFNICNVSACRSIRMSGVLFCKTRRHHRFERTGLVLTDGVLLFFQAYVRRFTGRQLSQTHHDHTDTVDLRQCYVYAGTITRHDILYYDETSCVDFPRQSAVSRIYLQDGWTSSDDSASTTFVIWHNPAKTVSHSQGDLQGEHADQKQQQLSGWTRVPALGVAGRTFVFQTRSRIERDRWVLALQTEMDRLQEEENVRSVQHSAEV